MASSSSPTETLSVPVPGTVTGTCRVCRCTDENGCVAGCSWSNAAHTLCTLCVGYSHAIKFVARADPRPQPRTKSRIVMAARPFIHVYTPNTAKDWKDLIRRHALRNAPREPWDGPIRVDAAFYFARPKYLERPSVTSDRIPHAVMPDLDNLQKAMLDAITNAHFWKNDSRVFCGEPSKWFVARGGVPGAVIQIRLWSGVA